MNSNSTEASRNNYATQIHKYMDSLSSNSEFTQDTKNFIATRLFTLQQPDSSASKNTNANKHLNTSIDKMDSLDFREILETSTIDRSKNKNSTIQVDRNDIARKIKSKLNSKSYNLQDLDLILGIQDTQPSNAGRPSGGDGGSSFNNDTMKINDQSLMLDTFSKNQTLEMGIKKQEPLRNIQEQLQTMSTNEFKRRLKENSKQTSQAHNNSCVLPYRDQRSIDQRNFSFSDITHNCLEQIDDSQEQKIDEGGEYLISKEEEFEAQNFYDYINNPYSFNHQNNNEISIHDQSSFIQDQDRNYNSMVKIENSNTRQFLRTNSSFLRGSTVKNHKQSLYEESSNSVNVSAVKHKSGQKVNSKLIQFKEELNSIFPSNGKDTQSFLLNRSNSSIANFSNYNHQLRTQSQGSRIGTMNNSKAQIFYVNDSTYDLPLQQPQIISKQSHISIQPRNISLYSQNSINEVIRNQSAHQQLQEEKYKLQLQKDSEVEMIKQDLENKYKLDLTNLKDELKDVKKKYKLQLKIEIDKCKQQENEKFKDILKTYEKKIKEKWEQKQRELKVIEFNKYGEYVEAERNELRRQLKELEARYMNQLQQQRQEFLQSQNDREEGIIARQKLDYEQLINELQELKKQRQQQDEAQADTAMKHQQQMTEKIERVIQEEQAKYKEMLSENEKLKLKVELLSDQVNSLQKENVGLKELNISLTRTKQINGCSQCGVLMLANEKLIGRMQKYEVMLKYKNKNQSSTYALMTNPDKENLLSKGKQIK